MDFYNSTPSNETYSPDSPSETNDYAIIGIIALSIFAVIILICIVYCLLKYCGCCRASHYSIEHDISNRGITVAGDLAYRREGVELKYLQMTENRAGHYASMAYEGDPPLTMQRSSLQGFKWFNACQAAKEKPTLGETGKILRKLVRYKIHMSRVHSGFAAEFVPPVPLPIDRVGRWVAESVVAESIGDGATVIICGFGGLYKPVAYYRALRKAYLKTGHPAGLTVMTCTAQGARGRYPGTAEDLVSSGCEGLLSSYISGHLETVPRILRKADALDGVAVHTLPQGAFSVLIRALNYGHEALTTVNGTDSFLEHGSLVGTCCDGANYATLNKTPAPSAGPDGADAGGGGSSMTYSLPVPDVALLTCPVADLEGNCYYVPCVTVTMAENMDAAQLVSRRGGLVFVLVGEVLTYAAIAALCAPATPEVAISRNVINGGIVVDPSLEIIPSVPIRHVLNHRLRPWTAKSPDLAPVSLDLSDYQALATALTTSPSAPPPLPKTLHYLRTINSIAKVTPPRGAKSDRVSLNGALLVLSILRSGEIYAQKRDNRQGSTILVNVGVGLPEEVVFSLVNGGAVPDSRLTFSTEAGAWGGIPAPGIFFGASVYPEKIFPSSLMFSIYATRGIDLALLGFLEVDSAMRFNASQRLPHHHHPHREPDSSKTVASAAVGPGGFIDVAMAASIIVFMGIFCQKTSAGAIRKKFVSEVHSTTFDAAAALQRGKIIYIATDVGVFRCTENGLLLEEVCVFPPSPWSHQRATTIRPGCPICFLEWQFSCLIVRITIQVYEDIDVDCDVLAVSEAKITVSHTMRRCSYPNRSVDYAW